MAVRRSVEQETRSQERRSVELSRLSDDTPSSSMLTHRPEETLLWQGTSIRAASRPLSKTRRGKARSASDRMSSGKGNCATHHTPTRSMARAEYLQGQRKSETRQIHFEGKRKNRREGRADSQHPPGRRTRAISSTRKLYGLSFMYHTNQL